MPLFSTLIKAFTPLESIGDLTSQRVYDLFAGPRATSGANVNLSTVMGLPAAYACNRVLAEGVASLPLFLFERVTIENEAFPRGRDHAYNHPLYKILHSEPNPYMSTFKLRETLQGHLGFRGNAFCNIERDRFTGQPKYLWPLRPDRMGRPYSTENEGRLVYPYQVPDGRVVDIQGFDILHIRGMGDDGLWGYSPITLFREAFGLSLASREYASRFYGQGARPGGVLQAKGKLTDESAQRIKSSWLSAHEGLSAAHRIAVLEEGLEWHQIGMTNEDAQFIEQQQFSLGDMARIFNIKPHKIGDLSHATYTNIEQQAIEHVTDTLMPWLINWEQEYDRSLILPGERERFYTKHIVTGLLRGDATARSSFYTAGLNGGWLSPDEIREWEELNPEPDGVGNVYYRPLNTAMVGPGAETPVTEPTSPDGPTSSS